MANPLEMSHHVIDLECGRHRGSPADVGGATSEAAEWEEEEEENKGSFGFSDADGEGSCHSNEFHSTADGDIVSNYDDHTEILVDECSDSTRVSSVTDDVSKAADLETKVHHLKRSVVIERDCRICHLSLVSSSPGCGIAIELGCSCKDDLAAAHKHCAETWFKIKGNKICEICNSIVRNVAGPNDIESAQQAHELNAIADNNATAASTMPSGAQTTSGSETRSCLNGHRFLNFLLACMVFAFVISWLFHFNIPS